MHFVLFFVHFALSMEKILTGWDSCHGTCFKLSANESSHCLPICGLMPAAEVQKEGVGAALFLASLILD